MPRHPLSPDTLSELRRQLAPLPPRSAERRQRIQAAAAFYGVSEPTLYRLLRQRQHPRALGVPTGASPGSYPKRSWSATSNSSRPSKSARPMAKAAISPRVRPFVCWKTMAWTRPRGTCKPPKGS